MNHHKLTLNVDGEIIPVRPSEQHEYLLETKLVAKGYGVARRVIQEHKKEHADELLEGKHWVVGNSDTLGGNQKVIFWTKRGIVRLGFFIRSERAKRFRDAAEDLVAAALPGATRPSSSLADAFARAAQVLRGGGAVAEALAILAPSLPYGSVSKQSGRPRTRLVPAYYTSRFNRDAATIRYLGLQVAIQQDFLNDLIEQGEANDLVLAGGGK